MAKKQITIQKYFRPSLGKMVNHEGYSRTVNAEDSKPKYVRPQIRQSGKYAGEPESVAKLLEDESVFDKVCSEIQKQLKISVEDSKYLTRAKWAYIDDDLKKGKSIKEIVKKIKPVTSSKRWTMWVWDNGAWQERFTQTREDRPKDTEGRVKWLPPGEKPIQPKYIPLDKDNKHKYMLILDSGAPYTVYADSDRELRKKLEAFYIRNKGEEYQYDAKVFNSKGREITEDQFITEMVEEIMEDKEN